MKWFKVVCLLILLLLPLRLLAAPHEPSPAGGGWLELNPELPLVQTEKTVVSRLSRSANA